MDENYSKSISKVDEYLRVFTMIEQKMNSVISRADDFSNNILNTPIHTRD